MLTARPATLADAPFLLRLRNDPATITASRVRSPVTAHDHIAWLEWTLADPARRLMIVWTPGESPRFVDRHLRVVGTYRLDGVGSDRIEVSLTIAPEHRGHGLAREIIELAARHAVRLGADVVTAEIRRENIPSFVAFFRNGFLITGWRGDSGPGLTSSCLLASAVSAEEIIRRACPLCLTRTPHHTNSESSIGRADDRHPVYDIHAVEVDGGVGLQECEAGDLWLAWERARRVTAS